MGPFWDLTVLHLVPRCIWGGSTDLYKYSSRCRTSYSRRIISCSHR